MDHRCLLDTPGEELPSSRFRKAKVYVDCNSFGSRAIEAAVELYGAERIVCGTDGSAFGVDWTRKALMDARISEEAREQILHGNAAAIMARVGKDQQQRVAPCPYPRALGSSAARHAFCAGLGPFSPHLPLK